MAGKAIRWRLEQSGPFKRWIFQRIVPISTVPTSFNINGTLSTMEAARLEMAKNTTLYESKVNLLLEHVMAHILLSPVLQAAFLISCSERARQTLRSNPIFVFMRKSHSTKARRAWRPCASACWLHRFGSTDFRFWMSAIPKLLFSASRKVLKNSKLLQILNEMERLHAEADSLVLVYCFWPQ